MLYWLLSLIYLFCGFQILQNTGLKRFVFYYIGILYVPASLNLIPQSMLMGHYFYVSMFIISMIRFGEFNTKKISSCPFTKILLVVFISYFLIGLFDTRTSTFLSIYRSIHAFCGSYFPFMIGWISLVPHDRRFSATKVVKGVGTNYNIFFHIILPITIVMTIYGLITGFTHTNVVLDAVGLVDRFLSTLDSFRAFRVTSFCVSSSVYGLACATLFLCSFFIIKHKTTLQVISISLLFVNLLLTATRAAIIPFAIGFLLFSLINKGITGLARYLLFTILFIIISWPFLPDAVANFMYELSDSVLDVIMPGGTGGVKYGGSNVDAREMQIMAAMEYLHEKPWFGHGFGYASEVLLKGAKHSDLLGMESYLCFIGIERGLVNLFAEIYFFIYFIVFTLKYRKANKLYADLGLSLVAMFIPFLIFAWVGGCWFFFMPVLGYIAKTMYLSQLQVNKSI